MVQPQAKTAPCGDRTRDVRLRSQTFFHCATAKKWGRQRGPHVLPGGIQAEVQQILSVASRALRCTFPKRNCKKYGYRSCKPVIDLARVGVATSEKHLLPVGIEPGMFCSADALSNLCHVGTGKNGIVNVVLMFCPNGAFLRFNRNFVIRAEMNL